MIRDLDRLKWLVLREFHVLPTGREAREMTDTDVLWCGMMLAMDAGVTVTVNEKFDRARFERLKEASACGNGL